MKSQSLSLLAAAVVGLSFAAAGCLLGSDPNHNSMIFGGVGGSGTITGAGGNGGTNDPNDPNRAIVGSPVAVFASGLEGFAFETYPDKMQNNLSDTTNPVNTGHDRPALLFDSTQSSPMPGGSATISAPYFGAGQYVDIVKTYGTADPQNWAGKTLHVRIKATTGTFRGGAQLYIKTGMNFVYGALYTTLAVNGNWQEVIFPLGNPTAPLAGYDPGQVVSFGLQLNSSGTGTAQTPVMFNVDSFSVDPPFAVVDAGTTTDAPADTAAVDTAADTAAPVDTAPPSDAAGN
jgi:hypothetical protein